MKNLLLEFKSFAVKGNMIDMAVGIIIGTAFNNVINTLVKKVIMPPLSLLTDGTNLANKKIVLRESIGNTEEVAVGYGEMFEVFIDFLIVAFVVFIVIKGMNKFKNRAENPKDETVETPANIKLLSNLEKLMEEQNELLRKRNEI